MTKPWEETSPFLADFGEACVVGSVHFKAILDAPQEIVDVETGLSIVSDENELRYATSDVTIQKGTSVTVGTRNFVARDWPRRMDNGVFSVVKLAEATTNG